MYVEYHDKYYIQYVNFKTIKIFKKYCERIFLNPLEYMEYFFLNENF